jgi:NAD/NADP transhydrogenase alpha subunit
MGFKVFFETGAGVLAGFMDDKFDEMGAEIMSKAEILDHSEIILRLKAPILGDLNQYAKVSYLVLVEAIEDKEIAEQIAGACPLLTVLSLNRS